MRKIKEEEDKGVAGVPPTAPPERARTAEGQSVTGPVDTPDVDTNAPVVQELAPTAPAERATTAGQTVTRPVDIPDVDRKAPVVQELPRPVKEERDIRRYIKKDGVFIRDLHYLWYDKTGKRDADGMGIRELKFTLVEAERYVTEVLIKSGRKVVVNAEGRLQAIPGWKLDIHVPGMQQSEQRAPAKPEGEARLKLNEELMVRIEAENASLKKTVEDLVAQVKALSKK